MDWFNALVQNPDLSDVLRHLSGKIEDLDKTGDCGCWEAVKEDFRPVADKKFATKIEKLLPNAPQRFQHYHIGMAKAGVLIPNFPPPAYPPSLRMVKTKRNSSATDGNEKDATWVCSHLCHNKKCANPEHMRWEPSWFNRLRDNCPGGELCNHRPDACLNAHRKNEVVDWTTFSSIDSMV
jgi:hypothetical protein